MKSYHLEGLFSMRHFNLIDLTGAIFANILGFNHRRIGLSIGEKKEFGKN
jgi:hypothetical protein